MKLFERTSAHYIFWITGIYVVLGVYAAIFYKTLSLELVQLFWLIGLTLPFVVPCFGRWLNLDIEWDRKMLEWFARKSDKKYQPEVSEYTTPGEYKKSEETDKPSQTFYRLGITDNNRVSLQMGYNEITMNPQGVQNLIDQLELFKNQILENGEIETDE